MKKTYIERSKNLLINNNINNKNNLKYCKECIRKDKEIVVGLDEEIIKINLKREKWLTFIKENPDSTTTEIRSLNRGFNR